MANLFIGMGGSGIKTIRQISKNQTKEEGKNNHFLFIDTDSKEFEGLNPDDFLDLGAANVENYLERAGLNDPLRQKMNDWFDFSCRTLIKNQPLKEGASAIRPQGRASILELRSAFIRIVEKKVDTLVSLVNNQSQDEINIYIVLSVAGGTGSSIFLDLSFVLNDLIVRRSISMKGISYAPWTILYMPDGFTKFNQDKPHVIRDYRSNVFATWKEIDAVLRDYYASKTSGKTNFSELAIVKADEVNASNFKFQPFANAILVDYQNEQGQIIGIENGQLYKNVAQFLRFISVKDFGGEFRTTFNNTLERTAVNSITAKNKWVKNYTAAGYTEIRGGGFLFDEYVQHKLYENILTGLRGKEESDKTVIEGTINDILGKHLFSRIERDGFSNKYKNKAEIGGANVHQILNKSLNNINAHYEDLTDGVTKAEDVKVSAENMRTNFNSIRDIISTNLKDALKTGGVDVRKTSNTFLNDLYIELSGKVLSDGFWLVQQLLDKIDEEIDLNFVKYDNDFKSLENKTIVGYEEIKNKDLLKQIDTLYNNINSGEGAPNFGKDKWYVKQLSDYKELIKAYFLYKAEETAIEIKKNICLEIAAGPHVEIAARKRVRELIAKLGIKIDVDLADDKKSLIEKFRKYTNDPLTRVVPDVSRYVSDFENSDVNLFKELYETQCGLSFRKDGLKIVQNRKKTQESSADLKTIEDLTGLIINDRALLTAFLDGSIGTESVLQDLEKLIETALDKQALRSTLPKYGEISNLKLKDWVKRYPGDFERYKDDFEDRAAIFCNLNTSSATYQKLWVTSPDNEHLCTEISNHNRNKDTNVSIKTGSTSDDVVAMIKMAEGISFENYTNYLHYKDHYEKSIREIPDLMFPHIDVRFKREIKNYPSSVDDNTILVDLMKRISSSGSSNETGTQNTDRIKLAIGIYGKLYFLAKFYELAKSNGIRSTLFLEKANGDGFEEVPDFPVNIVGNMLYFYDIKKTLWSTVSIENLTNPYAFELYTNDKFLLDYRNSAFKSEHNPLWQSLTDYLEDISMQIEVLLTNKKKERMLTAQINSLIKDAITLFTSHIKEIIPEDAKLDLMPILKDVKSELDGFLK
jgi:hypothetical protein